MTQPLNSDPFFNEPEAAQYLRMSRSTLRRRKKAGSGPRYYQDGNVLRYRKSWLDAYAEQHTSATPAAEVPAEQPAPSAPREEVSRVA